MKHDYSTSRQKGIRTVKSGKERVIIDGIWSLEVPAGYSYCAEYEKTATDINGNHYRLQVQKTDNCDFSESYGSEVSLTVKDNVIEFNNYTSDARDAKEILMQCASPIGNVELIKEDKNILVAICESIWVPGNYAFYVIAGARNVMYSGQVTFADDTGLNEVEIAKSFIRSVEPVLIKDLATGEGLVRLPNSYLPNFDTGKYLDVDNSFRVPIPEGYETKYDLNAQIKAAVIPKNAVFTSTGVRCKVGFVMYQDPINTGMSDTRMIIDAIKKFFVEQTGINFYNWPITTVRDTSKGTIVYSTITNTPCDQNTNPFLVVTGGKAYHCFIVITYDGPISDDYDTKWDADIITTAWLSRILFKGEKKPDKAKGNEDMFEKAFPDKSLYPHYNHLMNAAPKIPGAVVVVNQNGTEYAFYDLKKASDPNNDEFGDEQKALFSRIVAQDTDSYDLDQEARKMSAVFHVDPSIFDMRNDREAELVNGYMKRAYMFSALRSFGWTLSDYCGKKKKLPRDLSVKELKAIVDFIAKRNWLNYDAITYCKGLCSGSDLHVYYVPDNTAQDDKSMLLPSQEDYDRIKQMKAISPAYNEILCEVQSLDALRGSLKFIFPAIKTLHDDLANNRNSIKPLEGNEADIVYAWCALAMAAKAPFFTEDGPMTYFLSQPGTSDSSAKVGKPSENINKDEVKQKKSPYKAGNWSFQTADTSKINTKLLSNDKGCAARVLSITELNKEERLSQIESDFRKNMTAFNPDFHKNMEELLPLADKYASILVDDGDDNYLEAGKLTNTRPIHAFRSFVWTATNHGKKAMDEFPVGAPREMWNELASFIQSKGYVNYKPCKQESKVYGSVLYRTKEVNLIYTDHSFVYDESLINKSIGNMLYDNLFSLVSILYEVSPIMELYYKQLSESIDSESEQTKAMKSILQGWIAFAYACRTPFCIVQKSYFKGKDSNERKPVWTAKYDITEFEGGKFTAVGTSLVDVKCDDEVLYLPEGITDIYFNRVYYHEWNPKNAKKIVYPTTFTGKIVIPSNAEEIEILGDFDSLDMQAYKWDVSLPKLKRIVCKGMANNLDYGCNAVILKAENLKEIVFPEGLKEITIRDLCFNNIETVYLPESLQSIEEDNIENASGMMADYKTNRFYPTTTFVVYRSCYALDYLQRQFAEEKREVEEHNKTFIDSPNLRERYTFQLRVIEAPWIANAQAFVKEIGRLYEKDSTEGVKVETERIVKVSFDTDSYFRLSKKHIYKEAAKQRLNSFASIINNVADISSLSNTLANDISNTIEVRAQKERERKLAEEKRRKEEVVILSQSEKIPELEKAVSLIKTYFGNCDEEGQLAERCIEKINRIKADKYAQAVTLSGEGSEQSISTAINLLKEISPFEDSDSKIVIWQELLENERKYLDAVSSMSGTDIANLIRVKESFEKLGHYKDSEIKAAVCKKYIDELCEQKYQEARLEENEYSVNSQTSAISKYCEVGDYKDAVERIAVCESNIVIIEEYLELEEKLEKTKKELGSLNGLFKRRQRQEKEEQIKQIEHQLEELSSKLADNSDES